MLFRSDHSWIMLRRGDPAVVGRVESGRLLLDLRAVPPESDAGIKAAVTTAAAAAAPLSPPPR